MPITKIKAPEIRFNYPGRAGFSSGYEKLIRQQFTKRLSDINRIINKELKRLIAELSADSPKASGLLAKSWDFVNDSKLDGQGRGLRLAIRLFNTAPQSYFRIVGRKGGTMPPLRAIRSWCKRKGISDKAAYAIARKIAKQGTKRYRTGENVLDINPKTQKFKRTSPYIRTLERILQLLKWFL